MAQIDSVGIYVLVLKTCFIWQTKVFMPTEFHIEIYLKYTIHTFIEIENHGGVLAGRGSEKPNLDSGDSHYWWYMVY